MRLRSAWSERLTLCWTWRLRQVGVVATVPQARTSRRMESLWSLAPFGLQTPVSGHDGWAACMRLTQRIAVGEASLLPGDHLQADGLGHAHCRGGNAWSQGRCANSPDRGDWSLLAPAARCCARILCARILMCRSSAGGRRRCDKQCSGSERPDPLAPEPAETRVRVADRQVTPPRVAARDPDDGVEHAPVVAHWPTTDPIGRHHAGSEERPPLVPKPSMTKR